MTSEIALCRDHWKYRSKISLPHIAHLRCRKSRCIAIGILTLIIDGWVTSLQAKFVFLEFLQIHQRIFLFGLSGKLGACWFLKVFTIV
jgi:hypothetical protein